MQRYNNTINLAHFEDERDCQNKRLSCEKLRSNYFMSNRFMAASKAISLL